MRLVIKIGTSTLTHASGKLNIRHTEEICKVISDLKNAGDQIVLVSSGAIGMGVSKLNLNGRPSDMPSKQAAAAVGQCELMYVYDMLFAEYHHTIAQILITAADVKDEVRHKHFNNTLEKLLELQVIPVINENDTVATEEIAFGDNDTLAATVAVTVGADLLILMSDIDGLYSADPKIDNSARLIDIVKSVDNEIRSLAGGAGSRLGTGGMATKIKAAEICMSGGVDMIIMNGSKPIDLYGAVQGNKIGTRFIGRV